MRGLCLEGQTFVCVKFDETTLNDVTFKGATLRNVSFRSAHMAKKKPMCFDSATMDKLTAAVLMRIVILPESAKLFVINYLSAFTPFIRTNICFL
ncbi:hypothetical protein GCM10027423_39870 [Spirosoma arcticum]